MSKNENEGKEAGFKCSLIQKLVTLPNWSRSGRSHAVSPYFGFFVAGKQVGREQDLEI